MGERHDVDPRNCVLVGNLEFWCSSVLLFPASVLSVGSIRCHLTLQVIRATSLANAKDAVGSLVAASHTSVICLLESVQCKLPLPVFLSTYR